MNKVIREKIKQVLASASRSGFMAELQLRPIKYADELVNITAIEFCEELGLRPNYETEFSKMNEIHTLEQRLAKTRQIKQGMMQELLTGRTRLPFEKEC